MIPVHPLLAAISELPDSIFAFLTGKTDGDFKALRSAFKEWAHNHLDYTDWRRAWEGFWRLHGPKFGPQPEPDPSRSAEKVPTAFNKALDPLLTRAFPRNLRRVIAARGDILAFEDAIRGRGEFHRKYELEGYQPLSIEVLPPSMCPAGVPAVAVAHTFVQNGDLMYDPEIVFAVGQTEAWLAYEITQHPVGRYRNAYRKMAPIHRLLSISPRSATSTASSPYGRGISPAKAGANHPPSQSARTWEPSWNRPSNPRRKSSTSHPNPPAIPSPTSSRKSMRPLYP